MKIDRIDHVGVVVSDISAARAFFLDLGLEVQGETEVEGEWLDRLIGLDGVRSTIVMMGTPQGQATLELTKFHTPLDENGAQRSFANTLGIRHISFAVEDIEGIVARLKDKGAELFGEMQDYGGSFRLCYVRGPEGIIVELAEEIS